MTTETARPTGEEVNTIHRLLTENLGRTHSYVAMVLADWHAARVAEAKAEVANEVARLATHVSDWHGLVSGQLVYSTIKPYLTGGA